MEKVVGLWRQNRQNLLANSGWFLSGLIIAFGQPAWSPVLCNGAAVGGFALFWLSIHHLSKRAQFLSAWGWFFCVQLVQLSWLTSTEYQGTYILFVYGALALGLGLQWACVTRFLLLSDRSFSAIFSAAGLWVLLEWSRLWVLCGFSWNPIGLAFTGNHLSLQGARIAGIYGLSFWVFFVNALAWRGWRWGWIACALLPYVFGGIVLQEKEELTAQELSVGLVQTGLLPSQKVLLPQFIDHFIAPVDQWMRIISLVKSGGSFDLIVLPEAAVPFGAYRCRYSYEEIVQMWRKAYGHDLLPPLQAPLAQQRLGAWYVSNAFLAQALADQHGAQVIMGFDHYEWETETHYNSAFHFLPQKEAPVARYDKQILLPLAEYLPALWMKKLALRYGISAFFSQGKATSVWEGPVPVGLSICYEETFPFIMRQRGQLGARLFVNLTNDGYYPHSKLPLQHFFHARVRAVENGIPLVRACNTGVTAVIDATGEEIARLSGGEFDAGVLSAKLKIKNTVTLYRQVGDWLVLTISILGIVLKLFLRKIRMWGNFSLRDLTIFNSE